MIFKKFYAKDEKKTFYVKKVNRCSMVELKKILISYGYKSKIYKDKLIIFAKDDNFPYEIFPGDYVMFDKEGTYYSIGPSEFPEYRKGGEIDIYGK